MKVEYINPFIKSTITVFETMLGVTPQRGELTPKATSRPTHDISAVIGMSGAAVGAVVTSYPKTTALRVVSKFLGQEVKIIDNDLCDAIGELANIVTGNAKKELEELSLSISLPSVILGHDHAIRWPSKTPCICIPFTCELGEFAVDVGLRVLGTQGGAK